MDKNKVPVRGDIHVVIVGMLSIFRCFGIISKLVSCFVSRAHENGNDLTRKKWVNSYLQSKMVKTLSLMIVSLLGDPGLGKSQLLQAAAAVSPRGIYVCGNATTKAGLTVAVVKDSMTSDYAFEAGKGLLLSYFTMGCLATLVVYILSREIG